MMKPFKLATVALVPLIFAGCLSMQSQTTLDAITDSGSAEPVVEAYIEYTGPDRKWAGPSSFLLHVVAKDSGSAKIAVTPPLFNDLIKQRKGSATTVTERTPASAAKPMTGDLARTHLAELATALQGANTTYRGCLNPIRVRLVRADGSVLEKNGCRGQNGWAAIASQSVNTFITAAIGK